MDINNTNQKPKLAFRLWLETEGKVWAHYRVWATNLKHARFIAEKCVERLNKRKKDTSNVWAVTDWNVPVKPGFFFVGEYEIQVFVGGKWICWNWWEKTEAGANRLVKELRSKGGDYAYRWVKVEA